MKRIFFLFGFIGFVTVSTHAQIMFQRHYGGSGDDIAGDVKQTADGGYIITGQTKSLGEINGDVYLIKTNEYGDTLWTKTYGGSLFDRGLAVKETSDNGYIVVGGTDSYGAGQRDIYIVKTNSFGDTIWTRTFGGTLQDEASDVLETNDGYVIIGYSMSFASVFSSVYLVKTNFNGNLIWSKTYEKLDVNGVNEFKKTLDSGFIIASSIHNQVTGSLNKAWLLKTNILGDTTWTMTFENDTSDILVTSIDLSSDGGYILAGSIQDPSGEIDAVVIKTNNTGTQQWIKRYDRGGEERATCIRITNDNNYIISGLKDYASKNRIDISENLNQSLQITGEKLISADVLLMKINQNGDTLWTKTYGDSGSNWSRKVEQTSDNGFIVLGFSYSSDYDFYLIKTRDDGFALLREHNLYDLKVYPNPTSGVLHFQVQTGFEFPVPYTIFDIDGKTIATGMFFYNNQSITIPVKGVFIFSFNQSGIPFTKKVIVE